MSDTGDDSDDNNINHLQYERDLNSNKKRKVVMRIEFDDDSDSDEINSNSGSDDDDPVKPSCSSRYNNKTRNGKRRLLSSDDDESSGGSEITRRMIKGRKLGKAIIIDEEHDKSPLSKSSKTNIMEKGEDEIDENGFTTDSSNDETYEKCPICLLSLRNQEIGTPETCDHIFCAICIEEWSNNVQTCPIDRREFKTIIVRDSYSTKKFIRKIEIDDKKTSIKEVDGDNDVTCCEICGQTNREDIMLLCDGCNQGYHMDCLTPPLDEIPDGYWYCDHCFESDEDENIVQQLRSLYADFREIGIPETRFRIREVQQPRILRTRQSERIRANIARTRRNGSDGINDDIEDGNGNEVVAGPSSSQSSRHILRNSTTRKRTRTRRRRPRRKRRTYVVEYDVNNYDEKFALKTKKKYVRKRKTKKRRKTSRRRSNKSVQPFQISSNITRSRLAAALGINEAGSRSNISTVQQYHQSFSLFGNPNNLEYFSDESDGNDQLDSETIESRFGGAGSCTAVQTSVRLRGLNSLTRRKGLIQDIQPAIEQSQTVDILSSIMDIQDRWHNASQRIGSIRIDSDGTLNLEKSQKSSNKNSNSRNANTNETFSTERNEVNPNDIMNAPLYPRNNNQNFSSGSGGGGGGSGGGGGGGGGNYSNRYNNQSNYRNSTGNSGGSQYNRNSNYNFNSFRRDNSFQQDNVFPSNPNNRNRFNNSNNNRNQNQQNQQQNQQMQNQMRFERRNLLPFPTIRSFNSTSEIRSSNENVASSSPNVAPSSIQIQPVPPIQQQHPVQPLQPIPAPMQSTQPLIQPLLHSIPPLHHMQSVPPPMSLIGPPPPPPPPQQKQQLNASFEATGQTYKGNNTPGSLPVYGPMPLNYTESFEIQKPSQENNATTSTNVVPPLAPPPWNNNLFRLTNDYGDDEDDDNDDDSNCPNFSVYSAESMQVARSSDTEKETSKDFTRVQQEDEYDERVEDLVQLGDDDDIPAAIDSNKKNDSKESDDIYEPENPTGENDEDDEMSIDDQKNDDNENANNNSSIETINTTTESKKNDDEDNKDNYEETMLKSNDKHTDNEDSNSQNSNHGDNRVDNEEEEQHTNEMKIRNTNRKIQPLISGKKIEFKIQRKNVLELYDDTDWEEWNIEKPMIGPKTKEEAERSYTPMEEICEVLKEESEREINTTQENIESSQVETTVADTLSESVEEPDRSYTPCLDEKTDQDISATPEKLLEQENEYNNDNHDDNDNDDEEEPRTPALNENLKIDNEKESDVSKTVIDGMETELISEGEDEEILNENQIGEKKKKEDKSNKEEIAEGKKTKKEQFKKISRNNKERNYRVDKDRDRPRGRSKSRSRSRDKFRRNLNRADQRRRVKRKELERYNVRNVINQPRTYKDRYGRDTSRPPRSRTSHSRSRSRHRKTKSRSFSLSRSKSPSSNRNHSFSISPSPESYCRLSQRRRKSFSPRRSRSRRRSRSIHKSRSPRRSPIRRRSRSPLRLRSRSISRSRLNGGNKRPRQRSFSPVSSRSKSICRSVSRSRSRSNIRLRPLTPRRSRSRSLEPMKKKRKRSKDRKKKKAKKQQRPPTLTPSPQPSRHSRQSRISKSMEKSLIGITKKKKKRARTKTPIDEPMTTWSPSPPLPSEPLNIVTVGNDGSWTPPLLSPSHPPSLRVVLNNDKENLKKKREKKKKLEKRRDSSRKEKRKRRSEIPESPIAAPSKEVFASGDNILVSVSFNKEGNMPPQQQTTVVTLPPTREEILSKRRTPEKPKKQKRSKEKSKERRHKKIDTKPVAIIDLDRSPFQVIQSPRDIIVLTDSDHEGENHQNHDNHTDREIHEPSDQQNENNHEHMHQMNSSEQNMNNSHHEENIPDESFELQQLGPKTPPEPPVIKFTLPTKNKQVKARNPLHDEQEEVEDQCEPEHEERHEHHEMEIQNTVNKIGPNTPPESGPCSPDAYDPFDPTKSPSVSPSPQPPSNDISSSSLLEQEHSHPAEESQTQQRTSSTTLSQDKNLNPVELVMALMSSKTKQVQETSNVSNQNDSQFTIPGTGDLCSVVGGNNDSHEKSSDDNAKSITVVSNVLLTPAKAHRTPTSSIQTIASPIMKTSQSIGNSSLGGGGGVGSQSIISKLPLPKIGSSSSRQNGGGGTSSTGTLNDESVNNEIESPYSPGSEDYEDLFEPPPNDNSISLAQLSSRSSRVKSSTTIGNSGSGGGVNSSGGNKNNKIDMFDNLFGSTSPIGQVRLPSYTASTVRKQRPSSSSKALKKTPVKVAKMSSDDQIKVFDELPNSAVEMQVKDKFLRKLYRQERVVDEVKLVLKPHYIKKHISKEDYKEILRRAVPKICHSRSGEINPKKIQNLVEAYVKKFRQRNKLGIGIATGQVSSAVKCAAYLKKL